MSISTVGRRYTHPLPCDCSTSPTQPPPPPPVLWNRPHPPSVPQLPRHHRRVQGRGVPVRGAARCGGPHAHPETRPYQLRTPRLPPPVLGRARGPAGFSLGGGRALVQCATIQPLVPAHALLHEASLLITTLPWCPVETLLAQTLGPSIEHQRLAGVHVSRLLAHGLFPPPPVRRTALLQQDPAAPTTIAQVMLFILPPSFSLQLRPPGHPATRLPRTIADSLEPGRRHRCCHGVCRPGSRHLPRPALVMAQVLWQLLLRLRAQPNPS